MDTDTIQYALDNHDHHDFTELDIVDAIMKSENRPEQPEIEQEMDDEKADIADVPDGTGVYGPDTVVALCCNPKRLGVVIDADSSLYFCPFCKTKDCIVHGKLKDNTLKTPKRWRAGTTAGCSSRTA